jgi:hypothetical protein
MIKKNSRTSTLRGGFCYIKKYVFRTERENDWNNNNEYYIYIIYISYQEEKKRILYVCVFFYCYFIY